MTWEIPLRLLPLRATVKRFNNTSGIVDQVVYTGVPCRVDMNVHVDSADQTRVPSDVESVWIGCNLKYNGVTYDFRKEDQFHIDGHVYRVISVDNVTSANHHLEIKAEQLKTMQTGA